MLRWNACSPSGHTLFTGPYIREPPSIYSVITFRTCCPGSCHFVARAQQRSPPHLAAMNIRLDFGFKAPSDNMQSARGAGRRCLQSLRAAVKHVSQQCEQLHCGTAASKNNTQQTDDKIHAPHSAFEPQQQQQLQQQRHLQQHVSTRDLLLKAQAEKSSLEQLQRMFGQLPQPRQQLAQHASRSRSRPLSGLGASTGCTQQQQQEQSPAARAVVAAVAAAPDHVQACVVAGSDQSDISSTSSNGSNGSSSNGDGSSSQSLRRNPPPNRPTPRRSTPWPAAVAAPSYSSNSNTLQPSIPPVQPSSSSSSSNAQLGYMQDTMSQDCLNTIQAYGLTVLPGWNQWGNQHLLQDWNAAVAQLPAAVDRLIGICRSGPIKLVSFDLETCNFLPCDVLELAACLPDLQPFQSLVRPISKITHMAEQTTGISWNLVQDQPPLPQVLLQWVNWLSQQCSSSPGGSSTLVLMGHNVMRFDLPVLRTWATTFNLPQLAELLDPRCANSVPVIDTFTLLKRGKKELLNKGVGLSNLSLQSVRSALEIPPNQAHRALDDSIITMQVFLRLAPLMVDSSSSSNPSDLAQALLQQGEAAAASLQQKKQALLEKQNEQQQQQQVEQLEEEEPGLADLLSSYPSSSSSSSGSDLIYVPGSAAATLPDPPDPDLVESKVSAALATISDHDLRFDRGDLRSAWLPLTQEVGLKMKGFTEKQAEKLVSAGFDNLLKVLLYVPKIRIYAPAIRVQGSSSSTQLASAADSTAAAATASEYLDDDDPEQQLVEVRGRILAVFPPKPWIHKTGASWSMMIEAPTEPPEAGPVVLSVRLSEFGFTSFMALSACKPQHAAASQAQKQGKLAVVRSRVKQVSPWQSKAVEATVEWETDGKVVLDYVVEQEPANDNSSNSSSSSVGRQTLLPVYKAIRELKADDWLSKGRGKGVAEKALDIIRSASSSFDVVPAKLLERYQLPSFVQALEQIHRPYDLRSLGSARTALALQELTLVQVAQLLERYWLQRGLQQQQAAAAAMWAAQPVSPPSVDTITSSSSSSDLLQPEPVKKRRGRPKRTNLATAAVAASNSGDSMSSSDDLSQQQLLSAAAAAAAYTTGQQQQHGGAAAYQISNMDLVSTAKAVLPYDLTSDQEIALSEVLADLDRPQAMLRLLQGDVGCGKTVVAALACLAAAGSGCQALMLAPTELLASQHLATLQRIAEELPLNKRPRVELLSRIVTSRAKEKEAVYGAIAEGRVDILVSTQAALFVPKWGKLGLVVVDEQHKFGVKQREKLLQNLPAPPHMLLMTATPIPRTLALVTYGGLVLSTIVQMPPGRSKVATKVVVESKQARHEVYSAIHDELVSGGRVYIVCPLVSENEDLEGVRAATEEYERLQASGLFGDFKCGLLHGKMKGEDKAAVLKAFSAGETPVLIASTVVEVGIDEPEASIMLVENADRFGLAQLHQLRGRVGRGSRASRCFLMAPPDDWEGSERATERLRVLEKSHNGLHIAEADLKIRGPGDVWGTKQSGKASAFSTMTWQELEAAPQLLEHARAAAAELLPQLGSKPELKAALLAYGLMSLKEGQQLPVLRDGVSGV